MEFAYTPFSPTSPPGLTPDHEFFSSPTTPQYPQPEHFDWHIDGAVDSTDFSHFQNGVLSPEETGGYGKYLAHHHNEQAYVESQPKQHDHGFFASRAAFLRSGLPQLDTTLLAPELWVEQPWSPQTHAVSAPPQMEGWNAIPTPHSQHFLTPPINGPLYVFPSQLSASPTSTTRFNFDDCWARSPFSETEFRQADLPAMDALSLSPVSFVSPQTIFSPYPGSGNDSPTTYNEPEHTPRGKGGKFAPSREARLDRFIKRKKRQRATADTAKATCKECGSHFTTNYNLSQHKQRQHGKPKDKSHICAYDPCKKRFERRTDLTRHVNSKHEKLEEHPCPLCEKFFKRRDGMLVHYTRSCIGRQTVPSRVARTSGKQ